MKNILGFTLALLATLAFHCKVEAQQRPVVSTYSVEVGEARILDTYLSPLTYTGIHLALNGEWNKALPFGHDLNMTLGARIEGSNPYNPAGNASEWQGAAGFDWLMRRGWHLTDRLSLSAGGGTSLYLGAIYMPRNSNNPATAKAEIGLQGTIRATYRTSLGKLPLTIRDELRTPVFGIFFSQDYGQPYYNIYLGNRSGLVHAGWWGNNFCIDNLLSVRMHLHKGELGLGYHLRLYSTHVSNLDTRILTHAAVISWTPAKNIFLP